MLFCSFFPSGVRGVLPLILLTMAWAQVPCGLQAQTTDLLPLTQTNRISIPFELKGNFIVINVKLGNLSAPLRFIVDTGAENTILFEKPIADLLDVPYRREFDVRGADLSSTLKAYLITGVDMQLDEVLLARGRSFLVLEENVMQLEQLIGESIEGILGADFLMRFTVEFNYQDQLLTLYDPRDWKPRKRHRLLPSAFVRNRPYVFLPIAVSSPSASVRKLLIDSGADLSLLLHTVPDSLRTPYFDSLYQTDVPSLTVPTRVANGLGGELQGSVGRSRSVALAGKDLSDIVTYFQPIDTAFFPSMNERQGIIGNQLLRRFTMVIDYPRRAVYLRPEGRAWKQRFKYDRSGLTILAGGPTLRTYSVAAVIEGSPAHVAGMRVGDRLLGINTTPSYLMSLDGILRRFKGRIGKRMRVRFAREGEILTAEFLLRELI